MKKTYSIDTGQSPIITEYNCDVEMNGKHIARVHSTFCGHVNLEFNDCAIIFHLILPPSKVGHVIDCIRAIDSLEFDRDSPELEIKFHHFQREEMFLERFRLILIGAIAQARQGIVIENNTYTIRKSETEIKERTRPLNATESIFGFVEMIVSDINVDTGEKYSNEAIEGFRLAAAEFIEKNALPSLRTDWKKHVKN